MKKIEKLQEEISNDHGEPHIYIFEDDAKNAINTALLINRPLLIRGETGVGKSQLAKAAAKALERTYIPFVVSASTEAQDLLWSFDAVSRLADAQIEGALCKNEEARQQARKNLALHRYIKPAPLWEALNWASAKEQYQNLYKQEPDKKDGQEKTSSPLDHYDDHQQAEQHGVVLLIDEIDKADSSVTNGLLEVLGANRFHPVGIDKPIIADQKKPPLIIITTNEERTLPDAFIRRCLSLTLALPKDQDAQVQYLVKHAKENFKTLDRDLGNDKNQTILEATAEMLLDDRAKVAEQLLHPLPGQAEYFDLLRGIEKSIKENDNDEKILKTIQLLSNYTSKKHPDYPHSDKS